MLTLTEILIVQNNTTYHENPLLRGSLGDNLLSSAGLSRKSCHQSKPSKSHQTSQPLIHRNPDSTKQHNLSGKSASWGDD